MEHLPKNQLQKSNAAKSRPHASSSQAIATFRAALFHCWRPLCQIVSGSPPVSIDCCIERSAARPSRAPIATNPSTAVNPTIDFESDIGINHTMNGMSAPFAPPGSAWSEHRTPDGRVYYYNSLTKVTQWTKPEELMTPVEVRNSIGKGNLEW